MTDRIEVSTDIKASPAQVWKALTAPEIIKTYMMGAMVKTDWEIGHPITWSGTYQGNAYEDKGVVKAFEPNRHLSMTHWSPLSPLPDRPANYHTVSYDLKPHGGTTTVTLTQENLTGTSEDQAKRNWLPVLKGLKEAAER